jgi:hypothetical protein
MNRFWLIGIPPGICVSQPSTSSFTVFGTAHLFASAKDCDFSRLQVAPKQLDCMAFCKLSPSHPKTSTDHQYGQSARDATGRGLTISVLTVASSVTLTKGKRLRSIRRPIRFVVESRRVPDDLEHELRELDRVRARALSAVLEGASLWITDVLHAVKKNTPR